MRIIIMVPAVGKGPLFCWNLHSSPSERQETAVCHLLRVVSGVRTPLHSWAAFPFGPAAFPGPGTKRRKTRSTFLRWHAVSASRVRGTQICPRHLWPQSEWAQGMTLGTRDVFYSYRFLRIIICAKHCAKMKHIHFLI